ncbi:MAG: hypothetical protein ACRYFS_03485 [Janthinobacterium lividum]
MKFNKTIYLSLAAAFIVLGCVSTQVKWLTPFAHQSSINQLAEARYQKYAATDFVGEKTIAENAFSWRHETWAGDDKPYQQIRQMIDTAIASGTSPMHLAEEYQKQAQHDSRSPLAQFRWGYSLWKTLTPKSTSHEQMTNGLGTFFSLAKIDSPNTYDYARLRYLVSYHSGEQTELGERLLQRNTQDIDVKAHLALDYTAPGPEPYGLKIKNRVIQLSKELIQANPKHAGYYSVLAEAYYTAYYQNGHHKQDALATIFALKKYLSLANPNEYFYHVAETRIVDLEQRLNTK